MIEKSFPKSNTSRFLTEGIITPVSSLFYKTVAVLGLFEGATLSTISCNVIGALVDASSDKTVFIIPWNNS